MSRQDNNKRMLKIVEQNSKDRGTCEELIVNNLGTIGSLMADISISLAIIADALEGIQNDKLEK